MEFRRIWQRVLQVMFPVRRVGTVVGLAVAFIGCVIEHLLDPPRNALATPGFFFQIGSNTLSTKPVPIAATGTSPKIG